MSTMAISVVVGGLGLIKKGKEKYVGKLKSLETSRYNKFKGVSS